MNINVFIELATGYRKFARITTNIIYQSWFLFKEHNTHFIQGGTLNRIALQDPDKTPIDDIVLSLSPDATERKKAKNRYTNIPVFVKYPMPFMMKISCDTCPGPHRPRSHTCTGNKTKSPRPLQSFMQDSHSTPRHFFLMSNPFAPPIPFTLEITGQTPRSKVARGVLIPLR